MLAKVYATLTHGEADYLLQNEYVVNLSSQVT